MTPLEVSAILFPLFIILVIFRVPVAIALGLACIPVFLLEERLTPFLLMNEMFKSYNAFILLAVPFFLLAANIMNAAGITDRLVRLSRAMVGHLPGGLGHVNVVVSMLFAGRFVHSGCRGHRVAANSANEKAGLLIKFFRRHHGVLLGHGRCYPAKYLDGRVGRTDVRIYWWLVFGRRYPWNSDRRVANDSGLRVCQNLQLPDVCAIFI